MEELLKQLLEGQKQLFEGQKQLFDGQKQLFDGQKQLFDGQQNLVAGQKQLFDVQEDLVTGQKQILQRLDNVESEVSSIKQDMGTKVQQRENTDIIKAILHNQEIANAKLAELEINTASKDSLKSLATKEDIATLRTQGEAQTRILNVLSQRSIKHEAEISHLKVVK